MSHQAAIPALVYDYFGTIRSLTYDDGSERAVRYCEHHPIITQVFYVDGRGWKQTGFRKRVSCAWLRKLRTQGVTHVALTVGGRRADFSVAEILRAQRKAAR